MIDTEELLHRLWKRLEKGYYDDKPAYQFSKDKLTLMYYLGWMDEESYHIEKQLLEQRIQEYNEIDENREYNCCKHRYLFVL